MAKKSKAKKPRKKKFTPKAMKPAKRAPKARKKLPTRTLRTGKKIVYARDITEFARAMAGDARKKELRSKLLKKKKAAKVVKEAPVVLSPKASESKTHVFVLEFDPTATPGFNPSPQQIALFQCIQLSNDNIFVEAVAGSGKSTSLRQGSRFMKGRIIMMAFNKKIADENSRELGKLGLNRVTASTFHSQGFRACMRAYPGVKTGPDVAREKRDAMFMVLRPPNLEEFPLKLRGIVGKLVSLGKQAGAGLYFPIEDPAPYYQMIEHHNLDEEIDDPAMIDFVVESAIKGLKWSKEDAPKRLDFDDQLWIPVITEMKLDQYDWVMVDEAQDTNPCRRALARKMLAPNGRIVFVGDRHQAIYGFTGADANAIDILMKDFDCQPMPLTVSYRCPRAVVAEAQRYVSHIQAHEKSGEGRVRGVTAQEFMETEIPQLQPTDAILCRNTKPVVSLAFQLIRKGIACHVEGRDIGEGLIKLTRRWKVQDIDQLHQRLEAYLAREVAKYELAKKEAQIQAITDKVETLYVLMENCALVTDLEAKISNLFKDTDGDNKRTVTLSTVHKAKGREWDRVYILGFNKYMPSPWAKQAWQREQENNLIYVAITRSQRELVYTEALEEEKPK